MADYSTGMPGAAAAHAATVARELITLRSLSETEQRALEAILDAAHGAWVVLYRHDEKAYHRSTVVGAEESNFPSSLDLDLVARLLGRGTGVRRCEDDELVARIPGVALLAGLERELDLHPALLMIGSEGSRPSPEARLNVIEEVTEVCAIALRNAELFERLRSDVFVDIVTHCYNRRAFEEHLTVELVRARRYERPLCLLLLDLDDFKRVNDILGHPIGDYALQKVGETLRTAFRTTDRVCRYGGDEFAIIFPETPKEDVLRLAERLRRQVGKLFPDAHIPHGISASIGVAAYPPDGSRAEELVKAADRALYSAKDGGRNQVVSA